MGTIYVDTGGSATNSGSTDQNSANLSGSAATVSGDVVTLDGSPDLSGVVTSGANQSTIYLNDATNSNQKIFWITAVDNDLKTVTVSVAPTGITSSAWAIGGRFVWTQAAIEGVPRAGDTIIINNSPAAGAAAFLTRRTRGDTTNGPITFKGKAGVRPVITVTGTNQIVADSGSTHQWILQNFEGVQQGASGTGIGAGSAGQRTINVKLSDAGGTGFGTANGCMVAFCEVSGAGTTGITTSNAGHLVTFGNYVHDCVTDGIRDPNAFGNLHAHLFNIIDSCGGRGFNCDGAAGTDGNICVSLVGNTVYGCGNSGMEVADVDLIVFMANNIFQDNGDAAGEYNVEWVVGTAETIGIHAFNIFYHQGGGGGANLSGLTLNSHVADSELTTDPLFTDAGAGDFSIGSTSPAKAAGFPGQFLGGSLGYLDIGAVQRQEPAAGGGGQRVIGG
jgi:hypothetical protein